MKKPTVESVREKDTCEKLKQNFDDQQDFFLLSFKSLGGLLKCSPSLGLLRLPASPFHWHDMTGMSALHIVSCNWYMEAKITQCIWVEILKMCIVACCSGQTSETVVGRVEIPETMSNKQQKPGRHFYFEIWFHKSTTTLLELWEKNDFIPFGISQITSQSFYPSILLIHNFWNNEQHKGLCPDVIPAES